MSEKHPLIGKILADDYQVISFLGKGGMGSVFVAQQLSLNRQVAIKLLPAIDLSEEEMHRFECEIAAMATLSHPNIVMIHHRGKYGDPPTLYYVMELLEGGSLKGYLLKFGKIPPALALHLIRPVGEALAFAHEQGCIHRDIKPDNLLFARGYRSLKIADFGIAKLASGISITQSQAMVGTFLYAAPEQMKWYEEDNKDGGEIVVDERADQYSLGIVLYEMVAGQLPYRARNLMEMMKSLSQDPIPLSEAAGYKTPKSLEWLISTMMSKSRENRFVDDETLLDAFATLEMELTASGSTRMFSLKAPPETFTGMTPLSVPPTSEKMLAQSVETMACVPQKTNEFDIKKLTIGVVAALLLLLVSLLGYLLWPNKIKVDNDPTPPEPNSKITLRIMPMYEPSPPANYPKLRVILISQRGLQPVQQEDSVEPGKYQISVILPGYECSDHGKTLEIRPSKLFHLALSLKAKPRKISPKIVNLTNGEQVTPLVFQVDRQTLISNTCRPGNRQIYALLENYQEIDMDVNIPAGEDTFQYQAALVPLKEILFSLNTAVNKPDGTAYPLDVYVDGRQVQPVHMQYQSSNHELRGRLKIAPNASQITILLGFYQATLPVDELYLIRNLEQLDIGRMFTHLSQFQDRALLMQELTRLLKEDKGKFELLAPAAQEKLYQFLVEHSLSRDYIESESPIWELRRLVSRVEAGEYLSFQSAVREAVALSFPHRTVLWQSFLTKYPKGVYVKQARAILEYCEEVVKYENFFKESVRECFLSLSEKRTLQTMEARLKPEDLTAIKKRMADYVKKLGCGQTLEEMWKNR